MGGRGSGSGMGKGKMTIPIKKAAPVVNVAPAPVQNDSTNVGPYKNMTDAQAAALIQKNSASYTDPDFIMARKLYISSADANGDGFSFSQNLNYKLDNGLALDANEKWINGNIQSGMHDLGSNTNLVRYCHDDFIKQCGVSDYTKLSPTQLQNQLVGKQLQSTSYISTSYNKNRSPFHPNAPMGGGREVVMNIKASGKSKVVFGEKKQSEIILNKGTNMKIVGVHLDGTYATPRNGRRKPRIVVDIEAE